mmetsp:Transcript_39906/g.105890  ORF Transcript_39906/g.105890 Transcript_39906/m.105890 type:complete len:108 (-) Transcript_39906:179-502(-)
MTLLRAGDNGGAFATRMADVVLLCKVKIVSATALEAAWEQLSRSPDVGDAFLGTAASQDARRCRTHVTIVVLEIDLWVPLHLVFTVDNLRVQFSLSPSPRCRGDARF